MIRRVAPAKLNLYLRILGRRPDGYHELETVFERIDLSDELRFEARATGLELTCDDPAVPCGEENLILRAARLLQEAAGVRKGARIELTKRIPIAAGLGGGSSDAASTLLGLSQVWGLEMSHAELLRLGAQLGSDVSFFLHQSPFAVGRGRGERCEPLPEGARLSHVLVVPNQALSAREVYEGAQFDLTASKPSITIVLHALRNGSLSELASGLQNDLEPEAIRRCPRITFALKALQTLACLGARVSGSGPSVFGLCPDLAHAREIAAEMRRLDAAEGTRGAQGPAACRVEVVQTLQAVPQLEQTNVGS